MRRADKPTLAKSSLNMQDDTNLVFSHNLATMLSMFSMEVHYCNDFHENVVRHIRQSAIYVLTTLNLITRMQLLFLMAMKVVHLRNIQHI